MIPQYSNIITPPDFADDEEGTITAVLLIDPAWREVENLALILKSSTRAFNVYVYRADMNNLQWLDQAAAKVQNIIINTVQNDISVHKDKLAILPKAVHYGEKRFLMSLDRRVNSIFDYFVTTDLTK